MKRQKVRLFPQGPGRRLLLGSDYSGVVVTEEQCRLLHEQALGIFADCINAGATFGQALATIYMTGLHVGSELAPQGVAA